MTAMTRYLSLTTHGAPLAPVITIEHSKRVRLHAGELDDIVRGLRGLHCSPKDATKFDTLPDDVIVNIFGMVIFFHLSIFDVQTALTSVQNGCVVRSQDPVQISKELAVLNRRYLRVIQSMRIPEKCVRLGANSLKWSALLPDAALVQYVLLRCEGFSDTMQEYVKRLLHHCSGVLRLDLSITNTIDPEYVPRLPIGRGKDPLFFELLKEPVPTYWTSLRILNLEVDINSDALPTFIVSIGDCRSLESLGLRICNQVDNPFIDTNFYGRTGYREADCAHSTLENLQMVFLYTNFYVRFRILGHMSRFWSMPQLKIMVLRGLDNQLYDVSDLPHAIKKFRCIVHPIPNPVELYMYEDQRLGIIPFTSISSLVIGARMLYGLFSGKYTNLRNIGIWGAVYELPRIFFSQRLEVYSFAQDLLHHVGIPMTNSEFDSEKFSWLFYLALFVWISVKHDAKVPLTVRFYEVSLEALRQLPVDSSGVDWLEVLHGFCTSPILGSDVLVLDSEGVQL